MVEFVSVVTDYSTVVISLLIGITVLVIVYISNLFKSQKEPDTKNPVQSSPVREPANVSNVSKQKKKGQNEKTSKQAFTHSWMSTSLKGHTGEICDMDFSPNGKFLVTCAEDASSTSSSDGNKNSPKAQPTLSRRQKKNRTRKDDGSPGTVKKKDRDTKQRHKASSEMSKLLKSLNIPSSDLDLYGFLSSYILNQQQLLELAFPMECKLYPGRALIFKVSDPKSPANHPHKPGCDVNAREFIPKENSFYVNSLIENSAHDNYPHTYGQPKVSRSQPETIAESRKCVRCHKEFFVTNQGEYLTNEHCNYHWGKLHPNKENPLYYDCCKANPYTPGCTKGKLHVWSGISLGVNGPLEGFVRTRHRKNPPPDECPGIYALDCEMCFTTTGLEISRVSVVARDGKVVYDSLVRPDSEIIDYNTRFSGLCAKDFVTGKGSKSLREVQNDLMGFIKADTILIGHGLENDLRALKMIHTTCVDTSVIYPHHYGLPYRRSLKSLAMMILNATIQTGSNGHDSTEDARTCISLMFYRVRKDFHAVFSA